MLTSLFQYVSLAVLVGIVLTVFTEIARLCGQLLRDRRADRLRIEQLVREIEAAASHPPAASDEQQGLREVPRADKAATQMNLTARPKPAAVPAWSGTRPFRVAQKTIECDRCMSIYLVPVDGKPLPLYLPGQFLTLSLKIPGQSKPTIRCYSLSDAPTTEYFRCTIKKVASDPARPELGSGLACGYIHDQLTVGEILDVAAPRGSFFLDVFSELPVVLIGAGIGITPLLSMLNTLVQTELKNQIYLFYGARNGAEHPFRKHLSKLATRHSHLTIHTTYSQPLPQDKLGVDYQFSGHLQLDLIRRVVGTTDARFYVCGPSAFMQAMVSGLTEWGVTEDAIQFEAFGPSAVRGLRPAKRKAAVFAGGDPQTSPLTVEFARSHQRLTWNEDCENLLDFAERHGIQIESGCRSGNCGTCATFVKSGSVDYPDSADPACEAGYCLPCIGTPAESLVLDA